MTDDISTASTTSPAPEVPAPTTESVRENFTVGAGLISATGGEDISEYVKERQVQNDYLDGKPVSTERQAERYRRNYDAIQEATREAANAAGRLEADRQSGAVDQSQDRSYFAGDEVQQMVAREREQAVGQERFGSYYGADWNNPNSERYQKVMNWHEALDPQGEVSAFYAGSAYGPMLAEILADNPEQLDQLAKMPPHQRAQNIARLEGFIHAQQTMQAQQAQSQQYEPRRVSQAPPPIRAPKGAPNPPSDLRSLANKSDASDYIKARVAQERRAREDEDRGRF